MRRAYFIDCRTDGVEIRHIEGNGRRRVVAELIGYRLRIGQIQIGKHNLPALPNQRPGTGAADRAGPTCNQRDGH